MSAAPTPFASLLDGYHAEWRLLSEQPYNVLLEGTVTDTDAVLRLLQPHIREPIVWHVPPAPLDLPTSEIGALIVSNVASLSQDEQQRLCAWIGSTGSRTHIISTSPRPLFPLVANGHFDANLYYRLNVLLLHVAAPSRPERRRDATSGGRFSRAGRRSRASC